MNNLRKNWNCDNDKCTEPQGEVRKLPAGGGANMILCRACYEHELRYRRQRNLELGSACQFDLPQWEDLEVYDPS